MSSSLLPSRIFVPGSGRAAERAVVGVGGGLFRELHSRAFWACHVAAGFCEVQERAVRQGSAGTFGICSYQQERSALQSLQGEGVEREREWE